MQNFFNKNNVGGEMKKIPYAHTLFTLKADKAGPNNMALRENFSSSNRHAFDLDVKLPCDLAAKCTTNQNQTI